jgi:hypothetical protein
MFARSTPPAALKPRFDLAEANLVRGGRRLHLDGKPRCRAGCIRREPTTSELRDRERRGFVQRTGRHLDRVPDAFAVGEGDPNNQLPS